MASYDESLGHAGYAIRLNNQFQVFSTAPSGADVIEFTLSGGCAPGYPTPGPPGHQIPWAVTAPGYNPIGPPGHPIPRIRFLWIVPMPQSPGGAAGEIGRG